MEILKQMSKYENNKICNNMDTYNNMNARVILHNISTPSFPNLLSICMWKI